MSDRIRKQTLKPHLWFIRLIGVIVPRRLRADWRQEWAAELKYREAMLSEWDKLDWRNKFDLLRRSLGAFWDALMLQPQRLEDEMFQDLRYGLRMLLKNPGFTFVAILTLALGIGANTAIFQLLDAVQMRSLPVTRPQELAKIQIIGGSHGIGIYQGFNGEMTGPLWEQIRDNQEAFSGVFAWGSAGFIVGRGAQARSVNGLWVSGEMFQTLGVHPYRGRFFNDADDRHGCAAQGVVISHAFWQSEFGGLDSAIGKTLIIGDQAFEVIGVAPPEFFGLEVGRSFDIAVPICTGDIWGGNVVGRGDLYWLTVMGRLKPGWTAEKASAQLDAISAGIMEATVPEGYDNSVRDSYRGFRLEATPAGSGVSQLRESYKSSLWLLLGMTGLVLLIACANVANLLLARASARQKEMAVRLALGASRSRVIRQLLTESILLAAAGTLTGIWLARLLSQSLLQFLSTETELLQLDLSLDWRVLSFTALIAILTCLIFGLAPAIRLARTELAAALKMGGRGMTADRERFSFQRFLVVSQTAVSLVLLAGALLLVQSFRNLFTLDPGFRQDGIFYANFTINENTPVERRQLVKQELAERIKALPQVEGAVLTTHAPLTGNSWTFAVRVPGANGEQRGNSKFTWVSPGFFSTMDIPLLDGRDFDDHDTATSRTVVIVNETFVRKFLPEGNPIGATVKTVAEPNYPEAIYEVVGIVKDTKYSDLRAPAPPIAFVPHFQFPNPNTFTRIAIRTSAPVEGVLATVQQSLSDALPDTLIDMRVLRTQAREQLILENLLAWLSGFFGMLAVLLAMTGLYGVISYTVVKRVNEIGIRLAMGAQRGDVLKLILKQGLALVAPGIALGLAATFATTRILSDLLFGITAMDPWTLVAVSLLLAIVALIACYIPARKAASVDPMIALRCE